MLLKGFGLANKFVNLDEIVERNTKVVVGSTLLPIHDYNRQSANISTDRNNFDIRVETNEKFLVKSLERHAYWLL